MPTTETRSLSDIAAEIVRDWPAAYRQDHPAGAYAVPMLSLDKITDTYFQNSAATVVRYFLANAGSWRGDTARRVKAELKGMLKNAR